MVRALHRRELRRRVYFLGGRELVLVTCRRRAPETTDRGAVLPVSDSICEHGRPSMGRVRTWLHRNRPLETPPSTMPDTTVREGHVDNLPGCGTHRPPSTSEFAGGAREHFEIPRHFPENAFGALVANPVQRLHTASAKNPFRRMTVKKYVGAIWMAMSLALAGLGVETAHAVDQGNWSQGCAPGWACFWEGSISGSQAIASTVRDSNFSGDSYANGNALNDRVLNRSNKFASTSVRAWSAADYLGTAYLCIGPGVDAGPYSFGTSSGLSSFKSC